MLKPKFRGVEFFIADKSAADSTGSGRKETAKNDAKPNKNNTVEEIKAYLTKQNIDFAGKNTKDELLALVK